jgi:hypothetical protein
VRPLQQLKEENAAAAELGLKLGGWSCASRCARRSRSIDWCNTGLSATNLATLANLIPVLPALEPLQLVELSAYASLPTPNSMEADGNGYGAITGRGGSLGPPPRVSVNLVPLLWTGVPTRHDEHICRCFGSWPLRL